MSDWRCVAVRNFWITALIALASIATADRVVFVPTGKKIPNGVARIEHLANPGRDRSSWWLGYGLTETIEIEFWTEKRDEANADTTANLVYNITQPIADFVPGLSVGVIDAFDNSEAGAYGFLAITMRFGNWGYLNQNTPTEMTIAATTRSGGHAMFGFLFPVADQFRLIGEFDGSGVTAGAEIVPLPNLHFRALFRSDEVLLGVQYRVSF